MTAPPPPRILLTGATGYIGGTILTHLLTTTPHPITTLLRDPSRAATLTATYGPRITPILYAGLDDLAATTAAAATHDLVINTTLGYHPASSRALIHGLAQRRATTGRPVHLIHTSGTSNLADRPISREWIEADPAREFDDARDDVYGYEKAREARHAYPQRTAELGAIDAGLAEGVNTLVIMSPTIFGVGTGLFNRTSIQVPTFVRSVLASGGRPVVVGEGTGVWDHVHVEDLAELYGLVVREVVERGGEGLPWGKKGIIFSANGRHEWLEVARGVAEACVEEGLVEQGLMEVERVGLAEGVRRMATYLPQADEEMVELGLASTVRTVASVGRRLGWRPTRGEDAWRSGFRDDVKAVAATLA